MCGELDEEDRYKGDLCNRFLAHANAALARHPAIGIPEEGDMNAYLDSLYADVLKRIVRDLGAVEPSQAYERVAMQSLVLSRLAGFLAGHVALPEDPMRKVIEATMLGYAEAEAPHDPDHGHDHGHAHAHGQHHH
jgi:hypothetical protein